MQEDHTSPVAATADVVAVEHAPSRQSSGALAHVVTTLGAALVVVAAWLPWWTISSVVPGTNRVIEYNLDPAALVRLPVFDTFINGRQPVLGIWSTLVVAGIVLCPLLWEAATSFAGRAGMIALGYWTVLVTWVSVAVVVRGVGPLHGGPAGGISVLAAVPVQSVRPGYGLAAIGLALLLLWYGFVLHVRYIWRSPDDALAARRVGRAGAGSFGRGLLLAGLVIWAIGYLLWPWATVNCGNFGIIGSCVGVSASGASVVALDNWSGALDPEVAIYAIPILLGASALLAFGVLLWRVRVAGARRLWLGIWLLVASAGGVLADAGVHLIAAPGGISSLPGGVWRGDTGVVAAFGGLVLAWVGWIVLWVPLHARSPDAADHAR